MQCSLKCRIVLCAEWQISRYLYRCLFHDVYSSLGERISTYLESCPKRSSGVKSLSKCCCQCISYLFRRNFEHSCDQVTVAEVALIQVPFPNVDYKQKNKNEHTQYHGIFIPFKNQFYSKHESSTFLFFGSRSLVLYLHVSVKTHLINIQP